uniref:DNA polymerase III, chi subunit n=1 Tax=Candidatus Kentrum sp. SD TaxID=2126332 RepID=A0A451BIL6_9GAMM|nr:MAG: DNA polymerase III, chi subunit [Candidatus Kentron sp. SD]
MDTNNKKESVVKGNGELPRVDFYVLRASGASNISGMACRITEKAWKSGHRVFVHTGTQFTSRQIDDLLWTFRAESFVPHTIDLGPADSGADNEKYAVLVGCGLEPRGELDVVINLGDAIPTFFKRCKRIIEVVSGNPKDRNRALVRERYRLYRGEGCSLHTHDL